MTCTNPEYACMQKLIESSAEILKATEVKN